MGALVADTPSNGRWNLSVRTLPSPHIAEGEALVKVDAAAVNVSDVKNALGNFSQTRFPRVLGRDFAGVVEEGPPQWLGRRVFGSCGALGFTHDGTQAQYVTVPLGGLVAAPDGLSDSQLAAMGVPYTTAWKSLISEAGLAKGDTVLIIGAAGAVGRSAVALARRMGATVIGTGSRAAALEALPLDHPICVPPHSAALGEMVMDITAGRGADVILDTVGGPGFSWHMAALGRNGRIVAIASNASPEVSFNLVDFYHRQARLIGVDSLKFTCADTQRMMARMVSDMPASEFLWSPSVQIDLARAPEFYALLARGEEHRKVIIQPWSTEVV